MENRLIFLSMAAIDRKKAAENRWLPDKLFPRLTHRIAAAGGTHDRNELTGKYGKGNITKCFGFSFQIVICVIDIFKLQYWFHVATPYMKEIIH